MNDAASQRAETARTWRLIILLALCVLPVLVMAAVQYSEVRESASYRCTVGQPRPETVVVSERDLVSASVTAFPVGRLCVFEAQGGGTVEVQTGWHTTIVGLAATAGLAVLTVIVMRRLRNGGQRIAAMIPAAVVALVWITLILSAHTISSG